MIRSAQSQKLDFSGQEATSVATSPSGRSNRVRATVTVYTSSDLALAPGTRLGVFTLLQEIGRGGMGEVYRARDTKLDRDVAIKVLPEAFAHDAERLARFLREAKTLASLNHPNIAAI